MGIAPSEGAAAAGGGGDGSTGGRRRTVGGVSAGVSFLADGEGRTIGTNGFSMTGGAFGRRRRPARRGPPGSTRPVALAWRPLTLSPFRQGVLSADRPVLRRRIRSPIR